jgi:hypothetical protein
MANTWLRFHTPRAMTLATLINQSYLADRGPSTHPLLRSRRSRIAQDDKQVLISTLMLTLMLKLIAEC